MNEAEFLYRLPGAPGGSRPGTHGSRSLGQGSTFAAHARLFDRPDPRRLDLRASLASVPREWLVRVNRQRAAIGVLAIVDVSASMRVDAGAGSRLDVAIDFVRALGRSAFRGGDAIGLAAFDARARDELALAPRSGRGAGEAMAESLARCRDARARAGDGRALLDCAGRLPDHAASLIFLVSDFHWPLDSLPRALERLGDAFVVPLVLRDPFELEPPRSGGWLSLIDAESGRRRSIWLGERARRRWREGVAAREAELDRVLAEAGLRPLRLIGAFDAEALTRHFVEGVA